MTEPLQVAVGVIINSQNQVLISKRSALVDQPDCWEFPGGKVESGESIEAALCRELKEELGITVQDYQFLFSVPYDYGAKKVCLHVYTVSKYSGQEHSRESQPLQWLGVDKLPSLQFPDANKVILKAIKLPEMIQITGGFSSLGDLIQKTEVCIDQDVSMIQFRAHQLNDEDYLHHANAVLELCHRHSVKLILNRAMNVAEKIKADGIHLNRFELMKYKQRPCSGNLLLSASCHDLSELRQAEVLDADFCFLSPVYTARSHSAGISLGMKQFAKLIASCSVPVYALGGMQASDLSSVKASGGVGIAAISGKWQ